MLESSLLNSSELCENGEIFEKVVVDLMYNLEDKVNKYKTDLIVDLDEHDELTFKRIQEYGFFNPIRKKTKDGLGMLLY